MYDDFIDLDESTDFDDPDPLDPFLADGTIVEVLGEVKSGKEGTVYCCRAHPDSGYDLVAIKVFRAAEHRTFRNDSIYRRGTVIVDRRDRRAARSKSTHGRQVLTGMWHAHEYETLRALSAAGADVPAPITASANAIVMEYIGDEIAAAPKLQETVLPGPEIRPLFQRVLANLELFLRLDRVHGDLSPYNILYRPGRLTIIDFPQTVDARSNDAALDLLTRDVRNICRYWANLGVRSDPERIARHLWSRYIRGEL